MYRRTIPILLILIWLSCLTEATAQTRRASAGVRPGAIQKPSEIGSTAVVIDETLSVLRQKPSLFAESLQRMRRGREVKILAAADADGIRFYKVSGSQGTAGWIQGDALFGQFRVGDDERLSQLIQASSGFDQIEMAATFFQLFPTSPLRPAILLMFGDLVEETAQKLSRDAITRLSRREMAATAAPMHSYFLNFVGLDRYRKLGIVFLFNPNTRTYHYDGGSWRELTRNHSSTPEATEAGKRLDALKVKMERAVQN
jgi:hypothetical protein